MTDVPIALVIFNRPELARAAVDNLRVIRPTRLFVVADGARPDRDGEHEKVEMTRAAIDNIDWPCDITKDYSDENLGCGRRIHSGISSAMEIVDKLIILEDDCQPNQSFYRFADELLNRYEQDPRVMAISGSCFHDRMSTDASYFFSRYPHCWGWATWRRAWDLYKVTDCDWEQLSTSSQFSQLFDNKHQQAFWTKLLDLIAQRKLDTWDIQWVLACWLNNGLTATPTKNLVSNVGFTEDATHTCYDSPLASRPTYDIGELRHPETVVRDVAADKQSDKDLFSGTWRNPGIVKTLIDRFNRRYGGCRSLSPNRIADQPPK